ncbi:MAG: hypothetical protein JXA20_20160 [Spirochaetes bacterium]|nr:hypothetical protein [Spirochaetota bacterium]
MKLKITHLKRLFSKYDERLNIKYFSDLVFRGNAFLHNDILLPGHITQLEVHGIKEVEVFYDRNLYECLTIEFPHDFRKPYGKMTFIEMDRHLEMLNNANTQSRRKRYVQMVGDIYGIDPNEGKRIIVVAHNEIVDYRKWNVLKRSLDREHTFCYRNSEVPIMIFVDLSKHTDGGYVEKFKKNTDLISLMVSKIDETNNIIAPDFIPTEDVISVTDPANLLEEYIKNNVRLIIIGEQLNDSYKIALVNVRKYDKYVRMLVVPALNHSDLPHFFKQVSLVYNVDRWVE